MVPNWGDEGTRRRMLAVPIVYFVFYVVCFMLLEEYVRQYLGGRMTQSLSRAGAI